MNIKKLKREDELNESTLGLVEPVKGRKKNKVRSQNQSTISKRKSKSMKEDIENDKNLSIY